MLFAIVGSSTVLPSALVPRPPAMFFIFSSSFFLPLVLLLVLLFLIFLMFIAIAFVVSVFVAVARCQPHLATLAKVWERGRRY